MDSYATKNAEAVQTIGLGYSGTSSTSDDFHESVVNFFAVLVLFFVSLVLGLGVLYYMNHGV